MSDEASRQAPKRGLHVVAVVAVTLAAVGFFRGTDPSPPAPRAEPTASPTSAGDAPSYRDLRSLHRGPNAHVRAGALEALPVGPAAPRGPRDRAERRAYAGAPPVIPHTIDQRGGPYCLSCHDEGKQVGAVIAPVMTHERMDNCVQCHAPPAGRPLGDDVRPPAGSTFDGRGSWREPPTSAPGEGAP